MCRANDLFVSAISYCFLVALPFCLAVGASPLCFAQAAPAKVYQNLVGDWVGQADFIESGHLKHVPIEIHIKLQKDGNAVRMDYVYASKGSPEFEKRTQFIEFDFKTSTMKLRREHETADIYKSDNLDDLAQTGLGEFSAIGAPPGPSTPGDGGTLRFRLGLGLDKLNYTWESKHEGGQFMKVSTITLRRSTSFPSSN